MSVLTQIPDVAVEPHELPDVPSVMHRAGQAFKTWVFRPAASAAEWLFGLVSMIVGLSILATIPVVQLLSLGYLLESTGRVVRTGRIRDGFVGIRLAARVGGAVFCTWLLLWPARAVSGLWYSSLLINGNSDVTQRYRVGLVAVTLLTICHLGWAWFRGGKVRHFLWPAPRLLWHRLRAGGWYAEARDRSVGFLARLRLGYYFQLGVRGACGAFLWLVLPATLLMLASRLPVPGSVLAGLAGGIWLATVLLYLPFLQARFAASNRWGDLLDVRAVRADFRRAPVAFWVALLATLALALPLYLLKAELVPREAAWLPSLVFVVFIWPARLLTGWAVSRAAGRETPRHGFFRWTAWTAMLPVVLLYVAVVYFTQFISWYGGLSLYEQHAFLLPVPFLGL